MVPPAAQESPEADLPRNLFFGVEDRRLGGRTSLEDKYLDFEASRRQKLATQVIDSALQVADAVRTLRRFDRTGSTPEALGHLAATLDDIAKLGWNLINEVGASSTRYQTEHAALLSREDAAEAEAYAALNAPAAPVAPQPGAAGPTAAAVKTLPQHLTAAVPQAAVTPLTLARAANVDDREQFSTWPRKHKASR
ncbi:hypothetical protein HWD94_04135 [Pseudarthrobacter equi]|uniref:hypothetical protein n=1 Tax=Pseudarthrobacter equi TaxID=728066 RepID=UPI0021C03AC6|nr:hypothetical protein [Pseudarthrobacter equi]MCT9624313.1 hypothetical protein [Pseudarthrobacter equi]